MKVTAYSIAERFIGLSEVKGMVDNPQILAMLKLDASWPEHDEVPWCSAFVNYVCWLLRLPRSKSLTAASWLEVGRAVDLVQAEVGFDVVILGNGETANHVGLFAGRTPTIWGGGAKPLAVDRVSLLGGNQGDKVSVATFPADRVLGVRRLRG